MRLNRFEESECMGGGAANYINLDQITYIRIFPEYVSLWSTNRELRLSPQGLERLIKTLQASS